MTAGCRFESGDGAKCLPNEVEGDVRLGLGETVRGGPSDGSAG